MSLIEMMILGFLSERSMCGYELRKKMEQLQGYTRKFSDGAIYPATNRLVEAGLISEQASIRDGRQRRVFTLLDVGRARQNRPRRGVAPPLRSAQRTRRAFLLL